MFDIIIEAGVICLLIYTPLAFGGVTQGAITFLEIVSGGLFLVWLAKVFPHRHTTAVSHVLRRFTSPSIVLLKRVWMVTVFLFLLVLFCQFVPLPASLVRIISPATYSLYHEAASMTQSILPAWLPLSIYTHATETECYKYLAYATIFFLIVQTFRTHRQVNRLIQIIFAIGCLEAFYGILQFFSSSTLLAAYPSRGDWVSGTFVNKNHFAGYLEMVIPLTLGMLLTQFKSSNSPRGKIPLERFRETYPKSLLLLLAIVFMIVALLFSGSRGGILSFSIALIFFVLLARQRRLLRKRVGILLILIVLIASVTIFSNPAILQNRLYTLKNLESDTSFQVRWELWRSALHIFYDYPLLGSGKGTFTHLSRRYRTFRTQLEHFEYAENDYVQLLSETGFLGATLLLIGGLAFFTYLLFMWRRRHSRWAVALGLGGLSALVSLLIHSATDFNLQIPSNALLFTVIAALCVVILQIREHQQIEDAQQLFTIQGKGWRRYFLLFSACFLGGLYLFAVLKSYYAFIHYRSFATTLQASSNSPDDTPSRHKKALAELKKAIEYDSKHADYQYALGTFLSTEDLERQTPNNDMVSEAEYWVQRATLLNPSNPWYYYELGRLSHSRGDCMKSSEDGGEHQSCAASRYFTAALQNAPKESFLRQAAGRWFFTYDSAQGELLLRQLFANDSSHTPENPNISQELSQFLYEVRLDDLSEQEKRRDTFSQQKQPASCDIHGIQRSVDTQKLEIGNDQGVPDWKAPLTEQSERIQKTFCLPKNLTAYQKAALKVFMNNGGASHFSAYFYLDDQLIRTFDGTVPAMAKWYEIPFDIHVLHGKSSINVYIRVSETSNRGNFLQIWGSRMPSTVDSVFNFDTTDDLSSEKGIQTGEYLIRLILRKQGGKNAFPSD